MFKKYLKYNSIIWFVFIVAITFVLFWHFQISIRRFFDQDEFYHLYRAYLISIGQVAYRDFGSFYTPLFSAIFAPLFYFFQEQVTPVILSRGLEFIIFCALVFVSGLVGWRMSGAKVGLLAAFLIAFLPLTYHKTVEVRPETFTIFLYFLSFLFLLIAQKTPSWKKVIFIAGICFGISLLTTTKIIFAYPGLLIFLLLFSGSLKERFFRNNLLFHLGIIVPWLGMMVLLWLNQVSPTTFFGTFVNHWQIYHNFTNFSYHDPLFPLRTNEFLYGFPGLSLTYILNHLILTIGLVGMFVSRFRVFLIVSFVCLFFTAINKNVYPVALVQYYLPSIFILVLAAADLIGLIFGWIERHSKKMAIIFWIGFFFVLSWNFWKMAWTQYYQTNREDIDKIETVLSVSRPGDYFYDQLGIHIFRPSGYYFCCDFLDVFPTEILRRYPKLQDELRKNQNKFLFENPSLGRLPPNDYQFLKENYYPSGINNILVAGKEISCPIKKELKFELLVTGTYRLTKDFSGDILLDSKQPFEEEVALSAGEHKITCTGTGKISLLLNYTK